MTKDLISRSEFMNFNSKLLKQANPSLSVIILSIMKSILKKNRIKTKIDPDRSIYNNITIYMYMLVRVQCK